MQERITQDMKAAMKAGDKAKLSVLRMALSDLKNARIEKSNDLTEAEAIQVLKRGVKSRKESAEQYREAGRDDLADKEEAEVAVLESYLPQAVTGDALAAIVDDAIKDTGAANMKDMGGVMKSIMAKHGGAVDGKEVGDLVKKRLS